MSRWFPLAGFPFRGDVLYRRYPVDAFRTVQETLAGEANAKRWRNQLVRAGSALASARSACTALRALCTPFLYMVLVGFERRLPIGDLQLTRSGFFAAKSWPPL